MVERKSTDTSRARGAVQRAAAAQQQEPDQPSPAARLAARIIATEEQFQMAMPRGMEARQLVRDALTCIRTTPGLITCTQDSVFGGLMTFAQLGLRPGVAALGHGWLIPFKGQAVTVIGYQGYAELAHRTGLVQSLIAREIRENDFYEVQYGLADDLVHKPPRLDVERGRAIGYYAVVKYTTGGYAFHVMSRPEVERHRDKFAMAKKNGVVVGPWKDHFDAMALKTVWLRLARWGPKTPEISSAMAADDKVIDMDPSSFELSTAQYDENVIEAGPPAADEIAPAPPAEPAPEPSPDEVAEAEHKAELQRRARESFGDTDG